VLIVSQVKELGYELEEFATVDVELEATDTVEEEPVRLEVDDVEVNAIDEDVEFDSVEDEALDVAEVKLVVGVLVVVGLVFKDNAAKAPTAITTMITTTTAIEAVLLTACLNFDTLVLCTRQSSFLAPY
jgi:hypothetical protein